MTIKPGVGSIAGRVADHVKVDEHGSGRADYKQSMGSKLDIQRVRLSPKGKSSVRLAVVADTHSAPHPSLQKLLESLRPDAILHAGDIGDLKVLDFLASHAPTYAVRGNIDTHAAKLPDALTLDVQLEGQGTLRILLLHIAVAGPRIRADAAKLARSERSALIVCGHSHVPFIGAERGLTVFNPGSIGPRRFALPIVFGVIELGPKGMRMRHLDAETAREWSPP